MSKSLKAETALNNMLLTSFLGNLKSMVEEDGHTCDITSFEGDDFYSVKEEKVQNVHILKVDNVPIGFYWTAYNPKLKTNYLHFSDGTVETTIEDDHISKMQLPPQTADAQFIENMDALPSTVVAHIQNKKAENHVYLIDEFQQYDEMGQIVVATSHALQNKIGLEYEFEL